MVQSKWMKVFGTWLTVLIVSLSFDKVQGLLRSEIVFLVVFEMVMFLIMWLLNQYWLHVSVYLKPTARSGQLLTVNWVTLVIFIEALIVVRSRTGKFWLALATLIFVGITEEFTFRGLLLPLASKLGSARHQLWVGVLTSSILFGLAHSVNILHQSLPITAFQMLSAFSLGVLLAAIYLRTGSLIFPILLHGLNDFVSTYASGLQNPSVSAVGVSFVLVYLFTGIFLLRRSKRAAIKQPFTN
ncbi:CPBP family intramembrane glutamic endopeptidase [Furfurilactobacillus milii]|uniref:CPBP family intramembrane metalloprotease n=1 Tax=Furfurilactobacillus milii TaxID=2888272 RepID=A0ABT6DDZ4_9LACO|nr:CPBP family intramembrane glutamic endopeptidase [Furfurilactobacillus milii]QLE67256.1 hypothetical protein LROSL2_1906 [Furfurilactobacillus rossiae]MCF6161054.1 CPBP family intramembrane metalloprotease [Furfurilactobacillus milii]MCF6163456.1 CPBP family intramembrane metalloprotease [Furfurilactobacillus milii]MCF6418742.1 CPBP family intramembrane metalloprotease [Furfurilactobacillus milii]MDF9913586.1 CPBP family intramembrane metalloprotease [Furfurilactobacillus milii]